MALLMFECELNDFVTMMVYIHMSCDLHTISVCYIGDLNFCHVSQLRSFYRMTSVAFCQVV